MGASISATNFLFQGGKNVCEGKQRGPEEVSSADPKKTPFRDAKGGQGRGGGETGKPKREARRINLPERGL
jgi:hypothetical protein